MTKLNLRDPAVYLAKLCEVCYTKNKCITRTEALGFHGLLTYANGGAEAWITYKDDDEVIVCFVGTQICDIRDIEADLDAVLIKDEVAGHIHRGFNEYLDLVWGDVLAIIIGTDKQITFTGHSLGGAMAQLAASRYCRQYDNPVECRTYGSPRVGDKAWAATQQFTHLRYVNNNDIVPDLPPELLHYKHYGFLYYISSDGYIYNFPTRRVLRRDKILGWLKAISRFRLFDGIQDHGIDQYIKGVSQ